MTNLPLLMDKQSFPLPDGQYFKAVQPKSLIVLHFTAGTTVSGAVASWLADPIAVGTAFLVSPSGIIYQAFGSEFWAYHLGIKMGDPTHRQDKRSLGIEIVNPGPLRLAKDGKTLCFWPNNWTTPFCKLDQVNLYVKADFRGEKYFAAYQPLQIEAVARLSKFLCELYSIPKVQYKPGTDVMQHNGIATHTDFRTDKFDVGPAFPWQSYLGMLETGF